MNIKKPLLFTLAAILTLAMVLAIGNDAIHATGEHQTVIDKVKQYAAETHYGADHVDRWNRVLAGFGDASKHTDPMTAQEAQVNTYRFNSDRWQPVADALASVQSVVIDKEAALITAATEWSQETKHGTTHVDRWQRVLAALGVAGYGDKAPMTIEEAQKFADKGWKRWTHVIDVLTTLETDTTSTGTDANADTDTNTDRIGNGGGGDGDGISAHEQPLQIQTPSEIIIRPGFINNLKSYAGETYNGADHVKRWERVLYTFGIDGYAADSKMTADEAQKYADRGWKRWNAVVTALTDLEQHGMLRDVSATLITHDSITVEWWEPFIQRNYTIIISTLNETNQNQLVVISNQTVLTGASLGVSSHTVSSLTPETDYSILVKVNDLQQMVIPSVSTLPAPVPQQNENILPGDTPQPLNQADVTPPTIAAGAPVTLESSGVITPVTLQLPTVSDDTDANPVLSTNITGTWQTVSSATVSHSFDLGTHTVHWRATDDSSNTADAIQSIIIQDTTAPTIVVGVVAITATSEGATTPVTLQVPLVNDTTDANPVLSTNITGTWQTVSSAQVEHSFELGTHTVHWRATDASSNTADATQSVTIINVVYEQSDIGSNDQFAMPQLNPLAPTITPDATIMKDATGPLTPVTLGVPAVDDNHHKRYLTIRTNVTGTWEIVPGGYLTTKIYHSFAVGNHTVGWSVTDTKPHVTNATQLVVIKDTEPVITLIGNNHIYIEPSTTNYVDRGATCIDAVDGDINMVNTDTVVELTVGTYMIRYTCTDSAGNHVEKTRTVEVVNYTPGNTFTMRLNSDDHKSSPLGTIEEGGHVFFRLTTTTDVKPTDPIIKLQARSAVNAYNDSSGQLQWSGWSDVFSVLESKSTSVNDKGMALKGLYSGDFTECCIKGGYWFHDSVASKYYAIYTIVSHDDNYVGEAERHYEFRIAGEPAQKIKVIVHEDDSYHGHSYPDYISMARTDGGMKTDATAIKFQLGRSHFDGYNISLEGDGPGVQGSSVDSSWSTNIGPDHEPYDIITAVPPHICTNDGEGFVNGYINENGYSFLIGRLQVCY